MEKALMCFAAAVGCIGLPATYLLRIMRDTWSPIHTASVILLAGVAAILGCAVLAMLLWHESMNRSLRSIADTQRTITAVARDGVPALMAPYQMDTARSRSIEAYAKMLGTIGSQAPAPAIDFSGWGDAE